MRALVGLAICFGGCTFDPGIGPAGGADDDMGSGSGSGDPSQDTDGDGFPDVTDNCTTAANVDQRDHDDDGRGDACDVCPHLVDGGKDTDGDGVGDACDPRPTDPGDRIAFFEGFYEAPSWNAVIGANTWQTETGTLREHAMDAAYQLVRNDNPNFEQTFVDARVRINAVSTNSSTRRSSGIVLSYRDTNHYVFCGLAAAASPQGAEVNAGQVSTDFFGSAQYDYAPGTFPGQMSGDWLTMQARTSKLDWGGTRIECVTHRSGVTGTATYEGDARIDGDVGIRTNAADASFDYVFVVAMPNANT
ncbi:MAG TPA: thrombospondin type 3 repeat-containing protein [Kofleriaceae bacterium]